MFIHTTPPCVISVCDVIYVSNTFYYVLSICVLVYTMASFHRHFETGCFGTCAPDFNHFGSANCESYRHVTLCTPYLLQSLAQQ